MLNIGSDRDRQLREDYQNLLSVEPRLADVLSRKANDEAAKCLSVGRDSFRNSQVHTIGEEISSWPVGYTIPGQKALRGFNDDVCGRLLCPPAYNWNDPSYIYLFSLLPGN
jgi:hypothetical protein